MFFASGRSGHSWLGAVLDASPTAMLANQRNTFADYFDEGMTREELYTALAYNSWNCGNNGWLQVYNYSVPGLWQGGIDSKESLEVIGDKAGGTSLHRLKQWIEEKAGKSFDLAFGDYDSIPGLADHVNSRFNEYLSVIKAEPRFIVNIRHPGNIVATRNSRVKPNQEEILADVAIHDILARIRSSLWAMENVGKKQQWHLVVTEEFAMNTEEELHKLCKFVGIKCPQIMMETIVGQTHHNVHNTWTTFNWQEKHLLDYNKFITKYMSEWYHPMCY